MCSPSPTPSVAVVGEGVVGLSTALELLDRCPRAKVTVFHDRPFAATCSFGPAGLFRIDKPSCKEFGRESFRRFERIHKEFPGDESGVKLLSGHIQSDDRTLLELQEKNFGDIVYNFRWLTQREMDGLFPSPSKYCIHYTAYASEGNVYVPFLKRLCIQRGVLFKEKRIARLEELGRDFDVVFNCAGLDGGKLAGDDDSVTPSRGIAIEVDAPWQKHFNYRNFDTFTIPKNNSVVLGTLKQVGKSNLEITQADRDDIWGRYLRLHPQLKGARVIQEWSGLRPDRETVRVEKQSRSVGGKDFTVIHNYGHGSNGFTLSWGTAVAAVDLVDTVSRSKL